MRILSSGIVTIFVLTILLSANACSAAERGLVELPVGGGGTNLATPRLETGVSAAVPGAPGGDDPPVAPTNSVVPVSTCDNACWQTYPNSSVCPQDCRR
jgi:hypothetical protein